MADPRFFRRRGPFSLAALARIAGAELRDPAVAGRLIADVAAIAEAGPGDITFLERGSGGPLLVQSRAGACLAPSRSPIVPPAAMALLLVADPRLAFARIAAAFYPDPPPQPGRHSSAVVDATAVIAADAEIGPGAVVGAGAEIGTGAILGPCVVIGPGVRLGAGCRVGAHATLSHCLLGDRVVVLPGARIGQDGFGVVPAAPGHVRMPQLGRVLIGDGCEIGANAAIDRGALGDTVIEAGTFIDNLVQIGHNVQVGPGCIIAAQAGVAGSARLQRQVMLGGQAGVVGHIVIGAGARVAAQSGVSRSLPPGAVVSGSPAAPNREMLRRQATLKRLAARMGQVGRKGEER